MITLPDPCQMKTTSNLELKSAQTNKIRDVSFHSIFRICDRKKQSFQAVARPPSPPYLRVRNLHCIDDTRLLRVAVPASVACVSNAGSEKTRQRPPDEIVAVRESGPTARVQIRKADQARSERVLSLEPGEHRKIGAIRVVEIAGRAS